MSVHAYNYFDHRPVTDLRRCALGVAFLATTIAVGWAVSQLTLVCLVLIAIHFCWQGFRPLKQVTDEVQIDARLCAEELTLFQHTPIENLSVFKTFDTSDAGSLMRLVATVARSSGRMEPERALEIHLVAIRQPHLDRLQLAATAAEQAPMLGLGGSFLGLLGSLQGGADLAAGVGTMLITTIAGVLSAFALMGLSGVANKALDRHTSDLRIAASYLLGIQRERGDDDGFQSLFR